MKKMPRGSRFTNYARRPIYLLIVSLHDAKSARISADAAWTSIGARARQLDRRWSLPALLSDLFGMQTKQFHPHFNEISCAIPGDAENLI
jgi:hypothetical protein